MTSAAVDNRIIVEEVRHSSRGASGASIWRNCHGALQLKEKLLSEGKIKRTTNRAAAEGTAAHLVLGACLEDGTDAESMRDMIIEVEEWSFAVDDEMINGVQECLDWVRNRISRAKKENKEVHLYVERGLESFTHDDAFGTADVIIHIVGERLIVVDFKYGRGVTVEPTSDQNYYYMYLAVENYLDDAEEVKVVESWIAQPRIPHPEGTIRRHIANAKEVTDWWFNELLPDMNATYDPEAELVIGEHCRFCDNKSHCPALKAEVFEFPATIDPSHLTDVELGDALRRIKAIEVLKKTLEVEALRRARKGDKVPGFKLVKKKANRVFKDTLAVQDPEDADNMITVKLEDAMVDTFGMEAYSDPALKSPAQIEKLDGGNEFASKWAYSPDAGLTLAAESDKRMEVRPNIERLRGAASSD